MAEVAITTKNEALKAVLDNIKSVYYTAKNTLTPATLDALDMELPVPAESITFKLPEAAVTQEKLTDGTIWHSFAKQGDADIQIKIASIKDVINKLFMNGEETPIAMTSTILGKTYEAVGYDFSVKKAVGGLLFLTEDRKNAIFLPNVEMVGALTKEEGKTGYYNVKITALNDATGSAMYILSEKVTGA